MIFRRSESDTKTSSAAKSGLAPARREPAVSTATGVTPPANSPAAQPIRRAPPAPPSPANGYGRTDAARKLTVGRDISLNGEITTCDHLVVEGTVSATIKGGQMLEIAESGTFSGTVQIENADIAGHFDGELTVTGKLSIRATAIISGTLRYNRLQVDTGAHITGMIAAMAPQAPAHQPLFTPAQRSQTATVAPTLSHAAASAPSALAALNDEPGFLRVAE